jgi:hypothetical protein
MKKALSIFLLISLLTCTKAWSQACTPNNDTVAGIEPDTLAVAYVNSPYDEVIYFHLPGDTMVDFVIGEDTFAVHLCIDSLTIDSVHGLPGGFSFGCHVPWCSVLGNGNGCAAISGTPEESQIGIHPLDVFITIYVNDCYGFSLPPQVDTVSFYYIDVQPATGLGEVSNQLHSGVSCFPNPAFVRTQLSFYLREAGGLIDVAVLNMEGEVVDETNIVAGAGYHSEELDISSLPPAMYFIRVSGLDQQAFTKLQVIK